MPGSLASIEREGFLGDFLSRLGFILANDHCRRNCLHCPAFGDPIPMMNMPFGSLRQFVRDVGRAYHDHEISPPRSIASWRISDPLDYHVIESGQRRSTYDVAHLWREHLSQGLYLVTNGSEGRPLARDALQRLVREPALISQAKLTITPFDAQWGIPKYFEDIAWDVSALTELWGLPSDRVEDRTGCRFRINVKVTPDTEPDAREFVVRVLRHVGYTRPALQSLLIDSRRIRFKPVYDLGSYGGDSPVRGAMTLVGPNGDRWKPTEAERDRYLYAIHPDGFVRMVDMYAFRVHAGHTRAGEALRVNLAPTPAHSSARFRSVDGNSVPQ